MAFWDYVAPALGGAATGFMMGGPWGAVAGAGVGALGADQARRSSNEANDRSQAQATRQMDFQEGMSSTAHQREVVDLKAAGLNPVLSANGGAPGAPGAQGSVTPQQINFPDVLQAQSVMNDSARTDLEKSKLAAGLAKTMSETELNKAEKILKNKGMIRAQLEERLAKNLNKALGPPDRKRQKDNLPWFGPDIPGNSATGMFSKP